MENNLLDIWYADEKKINSITKLAVFNDVGLLSFSEKIISFKGKKNTFLINKESVKNITLTKQKMNWVTYILMNILLILFFLFLSNSGLVLAVISILFGNILGILIGFKTKWICIEYLDENKNLIKVYFVDGSKNGWKGIFGGTEELYYELVN